MWKKTTIKEARIIGFFVSASLVLLGSITIYEVGGLEVKILFGLIFYSISAFFFWLLCCGKIETSDEFKTWRSYHR